MFCCISYVICYQWRELTTRRFSRWVSTCFESVIGLATTIGQSGYQPAQPLPCPKSVSATPWFSWTAHVLLYMLTALLAARCTHNEKKLGNVRCNSMTSCWRETAHSVWLTFLRECSSFKWARTFRLDRSWQKWRVRLYRPAFWKGFLRPTTPI